MVKHLHMKPFINFKPLVCFAIVFFYFMNKQVMASPVTDSASKQAQNEQVLKWLNDLYVQGVEVREDSIFVSEETTRLLNNKSYRDQVYPASYTWEMTVALIKKQQLKMAFWYMINLYAQSKESKEMVVKSVLTYNAILKMDKIMRSVFYTYALTDPEIGTIDDGHSEITAPHIFERKLQSLKEILFYIESHNQDKLKNNKG